MTNDPPLDPVYLDRNENNYGPAPACLQVLQRADRQAISYYTKAHTRGVKCALSERLAREAGVPEEQILLGYGAEDLLKQTVQCYLPPGDTLMIPAYSWWYYKEIAGEVGGRHVEYPLVREKDRFRYDLPALLRMYREKHPPVLFLASPNNPTGNSLPAAETLELLEALQDSIVVIDQAYWYETGTLAMGDMVGRFPNVLVVRTFSKYYALAGLRIGFAAAGAGLGKLKTLTHRYLGYSRLSEEIALAALDSPGYYETIAERMAADKRLYYTRVGTLPGVTVFRSDANFLLVEIPSSAGGSLKTFLTERGLIVKFMNEPLLQSHIRITLGTREQNERVISALEEFFRQGG